MVGQRPRAGLFAAGQLACCVSSRNSNCPCLAIQWLAVCLDLTAARFLILELAILACLCLSHVSIPIDLRIILGPDLEFRLSLQLTIARLVLLLNEVMAHAVLTIA